MDENPYKSPTGSSEPTTKRQNHPRRDAIAVMVLGGFLAAVGAFLGVLNWQFRPISTPAAVGSILYLGIGTILMIGGSTRLGRHNQHR
jgi:hypothetical protein